VTNREFLEHVGPLAHKEKQSSGILASLTIAQAILESNWGTSKLAVNAKALFGIKANKSWTGKVYSSTTKECYDGINLTTEMGVFRAYDSWEESISDHSAFLTGFSRYIAVVGETDYRVACHAIWVAGYATDPDYPGKLTNLIESYGLMRYDQEVMTVGAKIFIDAGHNDSGWNTGAAGNGLREQDITYNVAKKLGDLLATKGLQVKLSRPTKDTNLGTDNNSAINARYTMVNSWGADYFISIHCNAGGGTGAETYYYADRSKPYAQVIQDTFVSRIGVRDRGVKHGIFGVIRYTTMPAVLVELAFIDTAADAEVLRNRQDDMAAALAAGFAELLGLDEREDDDMPKLTQEEFNQMYKNMIAEVHGDYPSEWAKEACKAAIEAGIFSGDGEGNFDWQEPITREAVAVILRQAGVI